MQVNDMLRILNVDSTQLPPALRPPVRAEEAFARVGRTAQPCVSCGQPATATRIVDVSGAGPRWIDTCTPHMIASTKRDGTSAHESKGLNALRRGRTQ